MKKMIILMLFAILLAGMFSDNAIAQRRPEMPGSSVGRALTLEQRQQIAEIRDAARRAAAAATSPAERAEIMRKMQADIQAVIGGNGTATKPQKEPNEANEPNQPSQGKSCMQQLGLSEEQKAQMEAISQEAKAAADAAATDEEKLVILEKMEEDLVAVLTEEQAGELELCRAERRDPNRPLVGNCMQQLNLSAEQKATIEALRQQAMSDAEAAETREAKLEIIEKLNQDVMNVLDPNQVIQLRACRENSKMILSRFLAKFEKCLMQLELTEEQEASIQTIRMEARKDFIEAKTAEERRNVLKQMREDIIGILDEEQAVQFQKCHKLPPVTTPALK